ncbi:MAG: T9SS type A sorting domain-containing protein [Ignavibacteriaceae bacterium]|nr:T9SS type A sorting domain-containing protein [Ignavibacteriaceae bacterium]
MQYFVDHQYGEVYADRTRYGGFAWNEAKGNSGKSGYHSIETGYYTYLYGNLLYKFQPATLHYNFEPLPTDREINLTPLAIKDEALKISEIFLDGQSYNDFNPTTRVLHLPAGVGGNFLVKYEPIVSDVASENFAIADGFELMQNYPNPFNPGTTLSFVIGHSSFVSLKVYDILGNEVATLVNEEKPVGRYEVEFNSHSGLSGIRELPSGVYFYRLQSGGYIETKKMLLIK